jgi:hypothetical protein
MAAVLHKRYEGFHLNENFSLISVARAYQCAAGHLLPNSAIKEKSPPQAEAFK